MRTIPTTIVDDFFPDPYAIREYALKQNYGRLENSTFPGVRTKMIAEFDEKLYRYIADKILGLFWDLESTPLEVQVETQFQYITKDAGPGGWAHRDSSVTFASVVYLTPDAPRHCGTAICKEKHLEEEMIYDYSIRDAFYRNQKVEFNEYLEAYNKHNSQYEETLAVDNIFNRAIFYGNESPHRERGYFGKDINDARLTLVSFITVYPGPGVKFPLQRG